MKLGYATNNEFSWGGYGDHPVMLVSCFLSLFNVNLVHQPVILHCFRTGCYHLLKCLVTLLIHLKKIKARVMKKKYMLNFICIGPGCPLAQLIISCVSQQISFWVTDRTRLHSDGWLPKFDFVLVNWYLISKTCMSRYYRELKIWMPAGMCWLDFL